MTDLSGFFAAVAASCGAEAVNLSPETRLRYGETTMPSGAHEVTGVVYPGSTAEVQTILGLARRFGVPLHPNSTGNNIGLGSRAPVLPGSAVIDLGRRMNRILEIDEDLAYAVVEPGVSYQMLHDELCRRGDRLMLDVTTGPPQGGMIGNALDKGAGYTPLFDHFSAACGMEVVLGTGEVLNTGDGTLPGSLNWHMSKYSMGPILDGLFTQSNYGIVTRMGVWLMPRPPAIRSFHFAFPDDDDLGEIVELTRPLKMANFVPTLIRVGCDTYLFGSETVSPDFPAALSEDNRRALRARHGLGAWVVSGAFYGASEAAIAPMIDRVRRHFEASGKARFIDHDEALEITSLEVAIEGFAGRPCLGELGLLKWRPGGGNLWFTPGTPMRGALANEFQQLGREIYARHGMDYMAMNVCGSRFARGLHVIAFDRDNPEEAARADACYRDLGTAFAQRGVFVGRAPIDYHAFHMAQTMQSFRDVTSGIKRVLDPDNIISPGRYGITPAG